MSAKLGTILPTKKAIATNNQYAIKTAMLQNNIAREKLAHCTLRIVGGENRYYETKTIYAVVAKNGKIRWFEIRKDGDYSIDK